MNIKLNDARGEQLRLYAQAHGLGLSDAIGSLLRHAGAAKVPGFYIMANSATRNIFTFALDNLAMFISADDLGKVANAIEHVAETPRAGKKLVSPGQDREIQISRLKSHTLSIVARDTETGEEARRDLTLDVARDLVGQIRSTIAG